MTDTTTNAGIIAEVAQAAAEPKQLDPANVYSIITPANARQEILNLDRYLSAPRRATGAYAAADVASFVNYVTNHHDDAHTTIWVDQLRARVLAVLNDHSPDTPAWGDHRVTLQLLKTPEWEHWTRHDGQYLSQEDFAEHIEDGLLEIVNPDSATMLEIAQTIQGKTQADWKTGRRLDNGEVSFQYQEQIQAGAGRSGSLEIPSTFELSIAPFYGEEPRTVTARLRYRIREGNLRIGYKLDRANEVLLRAVKEIARALSETHGFANVYMGDPRGRSGADS